MAATSRAIERAYRVAQETYASVACPFPSIVGKATMCAASSLPVLNSAGVWRSPVVTQGALEHWTSCEQIWTKRWR
jgi:hypothetical protein